MAPQDKVMVARKKTILIMDFLKKRFCRDKVQIGHQQEPTVDIITHAPNVQKFFGFRNFRRCYRQLLGL